MFILIPFSKLVKNKVKTLTISILTLFFALFFNVGGSLFCQNDTLKFAIFESSVVKSYPIYVKTDSASILLWNMILKKRGEDNHITWEKYQLLIPKVILHYDNEGYPFASAEIVNMELFGDTVWLTSRITKGEYILFDSIINKGNLKLNHHYLEAYFRYRKGKKYQEKIVQKIPKLIREIPFAEEKAPFGVEFQSDKAFLYLFLDERKMSQADGIIGFAPINDKTGKIGFSGELKLRLVNRFRVGEDLYLEWRAPEPRSQFLNVQTIFPYIYTTPLGIETLFQLDKQDTNYLKLNLGGSIRYTFNNNNHIKTSILWEESSSIGASALQAEGLMSPYPEYSKVMYGASLLLRDIDYIFNPSKGYRLDVEGSVGRLKEQSSNAKAIRYHIAGSGEVYLPLWKKWIQVIGYKTGFILGEQIYRNELFRLGGFRTLQGFDEQSIWASGYLFGNFEWRYLYERGSYINLFFNGGWYERKIEGKYNRDFPFGFGAGIAFNTKAGLFQFSYALGKQKGNPISFKTGKIHFGITVMF